MYMYIYIYIIYMYIYVYIYVYIYICHSVLYSMIIQGASLNVRIYIDYDIQTCYTSHR